MARTKLTHPDELAKADSARQIEAAWSRSTAAEASAADERLIAKAIRNVRAIRKADPQILLRAGARTAWRNTEW